MTPSETPRIREQSTALRRSTRQAASSGPSRHQPLRSPQSPAPSHPYATPSLGGNLPRTGTQHKQSQSFPHHDNHTHIRPTDQPSSTTRLPIPNPNLSSTRPSTSSSLRYLNSPFIHDPQSDQRTPSVSGLHRPAVDDRRGQARRGRTPGSSAPSFFSRNDGDEETTTHDRDRRSQDLDEDFDDIETGRNDAFAGRASDRSDGFARGRLSPLSNVEEETDFGNAGYDPVYDDEGGMVDDDLTGSEKEDSEKGETKVNPSSKALVSLHLVYVSLDGIVAEITRLR